jgi:hypothetical protein
MLTSYWLTPADILVDRNNQSGFYHGELRLLTMLERHVDDPYCDKLDKLFYFYVTDAEDPIMLIYSSILGSAHIKQGYNRFHAGIIRNKPYWQKALIISNILLNFKVSNDLKIYHQRAVEIFDADTASNLLTHSKLYQGLHPAPSLGDMLTTRRPGFNFSTETQKVLTAVKPGLLVYGSAKLPLNGTRPGPTVVVDVDDHGSVIDAIRYLFQQCMEQ